MTGLGNGRLAVLVSGGLDSAVLLGESLQSHSAVYPLYVRTGLAWESVELELLDQFLNELAGPRLKPLVTLDLPVTDLYDNAHWALTGRDVPGAETPDEAVYLAGRNVLLLSKALIWCHLHGVPTVALATLARNPFPDATPEFFEAFAAAVNRAVGGQTQVVAPFASLSKPDVIRRGRYLPLQFTLSCLRPVGGRHCGRCNKCAERRAAFRAAGVDDPADQRQ